MNKRNSNGIFGIIIFIGALFFIADLLDDKYRASRNEKSIEEGENLKTQGDLNEYALYMANQYCDRWTKACNYTNETRRWEEQLYVDGLINDFELSRLGIVIRSNDLPNSYEEGAIKMFLDRIAQCGWTSDRSKWPGQ